MSRELPINHQAARWRRFARGTGGRCRYVARTPFGSAIADDAVRMSLGDPLLRNAGRATRFHPEEAPMASHCSASELLHASNGGFSSLRSSYGTGTEPTRTGCPASARAGVKGRPRGKLTVTGSSCSTHVPPMVRRVQPGAGQTASIGRLRAGSRTRDSRSMRSVMRATSGRRAMVRRTHCPSRGNRSGASADNRILTDLGARCRDVGPRRQDRGLRVRCRWDNPASTSGRTTMAQDHEWNVAGLCCRLQVT